MKLNQSVRYGVSCLYELSKSISDYVDAEYISTHQHIPPAYTHKVLQTLVRAGLVFSLKGVGYRLARPLDHISALDVIEALTKESENTISSVDMSSLLEKRVNQALGSFTLGELVSSI